MQWSVLVTKNALKLSYSSTDFNGSTMILRIKDNIFKKFLRKLIDRCLETAWIWLYMVHADKQWHEKMRLYKVDDFAYGHVPVPSMSH